MKIKESYFNYLMELNDANNIKNEELGGVMNSIMDGADAQEFGYTAKDLEIMEVAVDTESKKIAHTLRVKVEALWTVLDSSVVNRWEIYSLIKGDKFE